MKIIEILRLSESGLTQREIAASAGCGKTTICDVLKLCKEKGITYETSERLTDAELHSALYPPPQFRTKPIPDWEAIHEELAQHKNLNLQFMWEEYRIQSPEGLSYSQFCKLYRQYRKATDRQVSLYNERKAGELMEVDLWVILSHASLIVQLGNL